MIKALRRQPVRAYLYGVMLPGIAVLTAYGVVAAQQAPLWLALGTALLGFPAVEFARSKVTPLADPRTADGHPAEILPEPEGGI